MSKKGFEIVVNGKKKTIITHKLSYDSVLSIAFSHPHPRATYKVTFEHGTMSQPNGELIRGDSVNLREGMVFNATINGA